MILAVPKEILVHEGRVAALPETVEQYVAMGFEVRVQASAGEGALKTDEEYRRAGAHLVEDVPDLFASADVILKVKQPAWNESLGRHEAEMIREGATLITFLHPAAPSNHGMVRTLRDRNITSLTMDGIPRISRAQRMDALTSMSTVTGYKATLMAANWLPRFIPMIGTAIGTVKPAKFLVVGAGVVGLQAIATAKRLGGAVHAVDIREDARKGADSLGAKVAGFETPPEIAVEKDGSARSLPAEWIEQERKMLAPLLGEADIVILSALVPGEVAPLLITDAMVAEMRPGAVVMDVAIDQGGNCAATEAGVETVKHRVLLCGLANIPGSMPVHASWLYANNLLHYVKNLFKNGIDRPDLGDEIVEHSLVTHQGRIVHHGALKAMEQLGTVG